MRPLGTRSRPPSLTFCLPRSRLNVSGRGRDPGKQSLANSFLRSQVNQRRFSSGRCAPARPVSHQPGTPRPGGCCPGRGVMGRGWALGSPRADRAPQHQRVGGRKRSAESPLVHSAFRSVDEKPGGFQLTPPRLVGTVGFYRSHSKAVRHSHPAPPRAEGAHKRVP